MPGSSTYEPTDCHWTDRLQAELTDHREANSVQLSSTAFQVTVCYDLKVCG